MDVSGAGLRVMRAAVFTALCVTLSAGAHVLLSGTPLPAVPLALVGGAVFLLALALAGRSERGVKSIAALLIPLELAADTVFTAGQQTCYGSAGGPVAGPMRMVGVDLLCAGGGLGTSLARLRAGAAEAAGTAAPGTGGGPLSAAVHTASPCLLLAAHITVGLLAAAWLRRGDAALVRLLRASAAVAFRPLLLAVATCRLVMAGPDGRPQRPASRTPVPARALPLLTHSVVRRGPPAVLVTA